MRDTSPHHAARFARPVADRFSRCGPRSCSWPRIKCGARLLSDGLSGTTSHRLIFPLGLSSISALPVLWAKLPLLRTLRFHSPQTFFGSPRNIASITPTDRVHTFQSFGALRNLPCVNDVIIRAPSTRSDSFPLFAKLERGAPPRIFALTLEILSQYGAAPRAPTCRRWRLGVG